MMHYPWTSTSRSPPVGRCSLRTQGSCRILYGCWRIPWTPQFELRDYIVQDTKVVVLWIPKGESQAYRMTIWDWVCSFTVSTWWKIYRIPGTHWYGCPSREALRRWEESSQWWYFHFNACRACTKSWFLYDSFDTTIVSCSEVLLPTSAASWIAFFNLLRPLVDLKKGRIWRWWIQWHDFV